MKLTGKTASVKKENKEIFFTATGSDLGITIKQEPDQTASIVISDNDADVNELIGYLIQHFPQSRKVRSIEVMKSQLSHQLERTAQMAQEIRRSQRIMNAIAENNSLIDSAKEQIRLFIKDSNNLIEPK